MRGHLRIRSERAPYRRTGLCWGEDRQLEIPATELDGAKLLELIQDRALKVEVWSTIAGRYVPIPAPSTDGPDLLGAFLAGVADQDEAPGAAAPAAPASTSEAGHTAAGHAAAAELAEQLRASQSDLASARVEIANLKTALSKKPPAAPKKK